MQTPEAAAAELCRLLSDTIRQVTEARRLLDSAINKHRKRNDVINQLVKMADEVER